jgi:S1-C subfamily serine protease
MPEQAYTALHAFDDVVGSSFFPRYLEPFAPERIVHVAPAPGSVLRDPDIVRSEKSVYKIRGENVCGSGVEGSGFLYSPDRLMTNAHVVAGVRHPTVRVGDGEVPATVVYYNSDVDVAVLAVHGLSAPYLHFSLHGHSGQAGAALGYPNDGPFDAEPVRVRSEQRLRSPNIYGEGTVTREVYSIRGLIRPGNSGGPFVSTRGRVLGVVFAASVSDASTGYALTADQVAKSAAAGIASHHEVSTGNCA